MNLYYDKISPYLSLTCIINNKKFTNNIDLL